MKDIVIVRVTAVSQVYQATKILVVPKKTNKNNAFVAYRE